MSSTPSPAEEVLLRYVERLALVFTQSGVPRMPARVFAYVLAEDAERYTAAELARGLRVSQAAISGAVRYLLQTGMLAKEREPGARSDHYRIYDEDIWSRIFLQRGEVLRAYEEVAAEGARVLPAGSPGALRMRQNQEFFTFLRAELPRLIQRWQAYRHALHVSAGSARTATAEPDRPAADPPAHSIGEPAA